MRISCWLSRRRRYLLSVSDPGMLPEVGRNGLKTHYAQITGPSLLRSATKTHGFMRSLVNFNTALFTCPMCLYGVAKF